MTERTMSEDESLSVWLHPSQGSWSRSSATIPDLAVVALGTGMRRGELCGLQWPEVALDAAVIKVAHSLEGTNAGLRLKTPKPRHGHRRITMPAVVVETLRTHRLRR
jgi:integrase